MQTRLVEKRVKLSTLQKKCVSFWLTVNIFTVYIGLQQLFILEVNDLSKLYSSVETILIQLKQT